VSLTSWQVNAHSTPTFAGQSLIVGGNLTGYDGAVNGNSFIGGTFTSTTPPSFNRGTVSTGVSPLDFNALKTQLSNTSTSVAAAPHTGMVDYTGGTTELQGTNSAVEVFAIDGDKLSGTSYLSSFSGSILSTATVILNISGTNVSMTSFGFNLAGGSSDLNLLLNFYEATSLTFANLGLDGSVLAPWAAVTGASGHIEGTLVAQSFASGYADIDGIPTLGHFEFHDLSFVPTPLPSPVPEPSQWALMVAGLWVLSAGALSSRSRHPATAVAGSGWPAVPATASPANRPASRAGA
jgi:choice-of-anchor A domain-containing protein